MVYVVAGTCDIFLTGSGGQGSLKYSELIYIHLAATSSLRPILAASTPD